MDKLIGYFMKDTAREFHVRELAKRAKMSPTTVSKHLAKLKKDGLLISSRRLGHLFYKADTKSHTFMDMKVFYNIAALRKSGIIGYLEKEFNHPQAIVLFGSFRKGEDIRQSDIDLLVITPTKKETGLSVYETRLGHAVQLFTISESELEGMKENNKELMNNIINGIILYGFLELFR